MEWTEVKIKRVVSVKTLRKSSQIYNYQLRRDYNGELMTINSNPRAQLDTLVIIKVL